MVDRHVLRHIELRARSIGFYELAFAAGSTLEEAQRVGLEFGDNLERWWADDLNLQVNRIRTQQRLSLVRCMPKLLNWARRAKLKMDAPGMPNHVRYVAEMGEFPFAA